jgi:Rrf2 family protein
MLSQTSELGIQILLYLILAKPTEPVPPKLIADKLGASQTYAAKVAAQLARAGIIKAVRGAHGGLELERDPAGISLQEVVEACQGKILADYCAPFDNLDLVCSFHHSMHELHQAITGVLDKWTMADLAEKPCPDKSIRRKVSCKLAWCTKVLPKI